MVCIPNLRHLRLFSLTARLQSGRKAAEEAHVSQPAVTQAIASLERQFGCTLFHRRSTGMCLTRSGEIVRDRIDRCFDLLAGAARLVTSGKTGRRPLQPLDRMVSVVQLSTVAAVVRTRSFATAARELNMAQSSVHRAVRSFERLAGEQLVARRGRGIDPTPLGLDLASLSGRALREIEMAFYDVDPVAAGAQAILRIGVLPLTGVSIVSGVLAAAGERYPEAELSVVDGSYDTLVGALRIGEIDLIVGALGFPPAKDLIEELLFVDEKLVVCRVGHPLSKRRRIDVSEIAKFDWVAPRKGTSTRVRFDALLGPAFRAHSPKMIETGSFGVLRELLLQSNRLALLSGNYPRGRKEELVALPVVFERATQPVGLTMLRDWQPTAFHASVVDMFRSAVVPRRDRQPKHCHKAMQLSLSPDRRL
jgi:LysR family transcriptional regulator of gallate degradation